MLHLQRGNRNKTVLDIQVKLWNKLNQTEAIIKFWTRNKIVLNDQFENSVFYLKIGIRDKQT